MRIVDGFEIVHIAEEHLVVPVGVKAEQNNGVTVLNEAAAFLLEEMKTDKSVDDLVLLLLSHYNVDEETARADVKNMVESLINLGIITH